MVLVRRIIFKHQDILLWVIISALWKASVEEGNTTEWLVGRAKSKGVFIKGKIMFKH